ncbi:unnamed protein product [marine sediment metagenome]|uniref:Uncharacterized protein n=1 Tax=marine sediment metagenome TaxID=412755 RepID=X1PDH7_9ZZZZ
MAETGQVEQEPTDWGKDMPEAQKEAYARRPNAEADAEEFIDLLGRDTPEGKAFAEDFARVRAKVKTER